MKLIRLIKHTLSIICVIGFDCSLWKLFLELNFANRGGKIKDCDSCLFPIRLCKKCLILVLW